jgi:hypothetical protein
MRGGTDRGDAKRCVILWEGNSEVSCILGGKASLYVRLLARSRLNTASGMDRHR